MPTHVFMFRLKLYKHVLQKTWTALKTQMLSSEQCCVADCVWMIYIIKRKNNISYFHTIIVLPNTGPEIRQNLICLLK